MSRLSYLFLFLQLLFILVLERRARKSHNIFVVFLCRRFTALQHILGQFGRGQLTYPHCSWASLLGSLPLLSVHSFASNWQLPFLNQLKEENGSRNYFLTKFHERMLPNVRTEPATVHIPSGHGSDRATAPGKSHNKWIYQIRFH